MSKITILAVLLLFSKAPAQNRVSSAPRIAKALAAPDDKAEPLVLSQSFRVAAEKSYIHCNCGRLRRQVELAFVFSACAERIHSRS